MGKILEVKDLHISFRTNNGTVKAVRGINFTLDRGETLAVVGESGSGKSVTARAIMGILAGNAIVESGEIFYDGKDLMKISEEDFHQLRGNRVSMIFQDPFSSLNPIMKIGQQLTEAMILNGKANQKEARQEYNRVMAVLAAHLEEVGGAKSKGDLETLKKSTAKGAELLQTYTAARDVIETLISNIDATKIDALDGDPKVVSKEIKEIIKMAPGAKQEYLVSDEKALQDAVSALTAANGGFVAKGDREGVCAAMEQLKQLLATAMKMEKPDCFSLGYYLLSGQSANKGISVPQLNETTRAYMEQNFLGAFRRDVAAAIKLSGDKSFALKGEAVKVLEEKLPLFQTNDASPAALQAAAKEMTAAVEKSIDNLAVTKDSMAHTFRTGLTATLSAYLNLRKLYEKKNPSKKQRAVRESADLDLYRGNVERVITRLCQYYSQQSVMSQPQCEEQAEALFDRINTLASKMVYRVTKQVAKKHAIDLMQEVGISEARKRYSQYPFQFSGGMRQRIVIAIALSANPDILICDEPTTALDVTIQAQILDLINKLKAERGLSVIFITHDLGVVANMADHIAVMYAGKIVEQGTVDEVFYEPAHPYTWALLASMPDLDTKEKLGAIPGTPPNMIHPPVGDAFAARNQYAMQIDFEQQPPMFEITPTHRAATWLLHPDAPKAEPPKIVTDRIKRMRERMEVSGNE